MAASIPQSMVQFSESRVHVSLLLRLLFEGALREAGVDVRLDAGDLYELYDLLFPGQIVWGWEIRERVAAEVIPEIHEQCPHFADIKTHGVTPQTFDTWLKRQIVAFGEYIPLTPYQPNN